MRSYMLSIMRSESGTQSEPCSGEHHREAGVVLEDAAPDEEPERPVREEGALHREQRVGTGKVAVIGHREPTCVCNGIPRSAETAQSGS